jgi:flagellar motor protein MotB
MKKAILLTSFIILLTGTLFSDVAQIGTTSNNYLKILIPAKAAAEGEAYVANGDDVNCLFYNPAGMAKSMLGEIALTHVEWFQSIKDENASILLPFSFGTLGLSLNQLSIATMEKTDASGTTIGNISPYSFTGTMAYSKEFAENLCVGVDLKAGNYSIDSSDPKGSAFSVLFDAGMVYSAPFLKGLSVGLVAKNIGPGTSFKSQSFMQPISFKGGLGYSGQYFNGEADVEMVNDNNVNYFIGGGVTLMDALNLRAGYKGGTINQYTAGGGLTINNVTLDYAFVPYTEDGLGVTHRITLSYKFGQPDSKLSCRPKVFSPNNDKVLDFVFFYPELLQKNKIKALKLVIYDSFKNAVRTYNLKGLNRLYWNGYNSLGVVVPDGTYYAAIFADYGGGVRSVSNMCPFDVDNTPPQVSGDANPKVVKPGSMTTLYVPVNFQCSAQDLHGIGAWKLVIGTMDGKVFKTYSGKGEPMPVTWDGTDDTGLRTVSTGTTYTYTFYAMDTVGNWGRSRTEQVKVLQKEIVINLAADTLFDIGKADVKISVYQDLKKISDQIKSNGNPSVIVEGHTDNVPMRKGKYADNLALSQARAEAVVKFFVELFEMNPKIFKAVGKGDTQPVATNDTPEGRKQNRRVTIRIQASRWE